MRGSGRRDNSQTGGVFFASDQLLTLYQERTRTDIPPESYAALLAEHSNDDVHVQEYRDALVVIPPEWRYGHDHRFNLDRYLLAFMDPYQARSYPGRFLIEDTPALLMLLEWGGTWAHFMQDMLPLMAACRDFLASRPDLHVVMFRPEFDSFEFIVRDLLRISNPFTMIDSKPAVHAVARTLYTVHLGDYNKCSHAPARYYARANQLLRSGLEAFAQSRGIALSDARRPYAVYLSRKGLPRRSVINEEDILQEIASVCHEYDAELVTFHLGIHPMDPLERFVLFYNASLVIGPDGGAACHLYFCKPWTPFIEVVSRDVYISVENLATGIPLRYYPVVTPSLTSHHLQRKFKIKPKWIRTSVKDAWERTLSALP